MPVDYSNPNTLKFLIENFEREQVRRMLWFTKHKDELVEKSKFPENSTDIRTEDVRKVRLTAALNSFSNDYKVSKVNHRKKPIRDGIVLGLSSLKRTGEGSLKEEPLMLPVEPNVKKILYERLPHGGRRQYLNVRKHKIPEEIYNFCQTSNNVFGWRLKDSKLTRQPPTYGRYATFKHDLSSRSGPQPDPSYYREPLKGLYSKCIF